MAEKRDFKMHEKLLLDVIKKQAGSIEKAVLEGVMNSIEAGASKVEVGLGPRTVTIKDDGKGFQSRKEIEEWFETFGQPHDASENKKWAQFRMGRGQMFAFGRNLWRTGPFTMRVDINQRLGYELDEGDPAKGCSVEIELYEGLGDSQLDGISREVERFVKFVDPPVIVRRLDCEGDKGKQVNTPPSSKKWGHDSCDEAFITLNESSMLSVYNMGVLVMDCYKHVFGVGGTVVSKRRLEVNFARNEVIRSCPVWRKIKAVIDRSKGVEKVRSKKRLSGEERSFLIKKLCAGELTRAEAVRAPIFRDVSGRSWSAQKILAAKFESFTTGEAGDPRADKLILSRTALVLDGAEASHFNCAASEIFTRQWKFSDGEVDSLCGFFPKPAFKGFREVVKGISAKNLPIPDADWLKSEWTWVRVAQKLQEGLIRYSDRNGKDREIRIGTSDVVNGWTDGRTFIRIARKYLKRLRLEKHGRAHVGSLADLAGFMAHELCHDDDDDDTMEHSPEFYEEFHQMTREALPWTLESTLAWLTPSRLDMLRKNAKGVDPTADDQPEADAEKKPEAADAAVAPTVAKTNAPTPPATGRTAKGMDEAEIRRLAALYKGNGGSLSFGGIERQEGLRPARGMTAFRIVRKAKALIPEIFGDK